MIANCKSLLFARKKFFVSFGILTCYFLTQLFAHIGQHLAEISNITTVVTGNITQSQYVQNKQLWGLCSTEAADLI